MKQENGNRSQLLNTYDGSSNLITPDLPHITSLCQNIEIYCQKLVTSQDQILGTDLRIRNEFSREMVKFNQQLENFKQNLEQSYYSTLDLKLKEHLSATLIDEDNNLKKELHLLKNCLYRADEESSELKKNNKKLMDEQKRLEKIIDAKQKEIESKDKLILILQRLVAKYENKHGGTAVTSLIKEVQAKKKRSEEAIIKDLDKIIEIDFNSGTLSASKSSLIQNNHLLHDKGSHSINTLNLSDKISQMQEEASIRNGKDVSENESVSETAQVSSLHEKTKKVSRMRKRRSNLSKASLSRISLTSGSEMMLNTISAPFNISEIIKPCFAHEDLILSIDKRTFKCDKCEEKFSSMSCLNQHNKVHLQNKYSCKLCSRKFTNIDILERHKSLHDLGKVYHCSHCDKTFSKKFTLNYHLKSHKGEKPYHCMECDKKFLRRDYLYLHSRCHTGEKPFKCDICQHCFSRKHHLIYHIVSRHNSRENILQCIFCYEEYNTLKSLRNHISIHIKRNNTTLR